MNNIVPYASVEKRIITIRDQKVLLDSDVAELYGVETKRVNEAVKNNPDKFPQGYILDVTPNERKELVENFDRFNRLKHASGSAAAFTEKGLYMLATILKSPRAAETTLAIVETFVKLRELSRSVSALSETTDKLKQKSLMQKSGEIFADILDNNLQIAGTETSLEINLALVKFKHTVKQKRKKR
ncbi:putative ORF6N domain protein [Candidatus Termititenax persephonae]|uniref:ORF6N domain protein n=1 Tax=Candidatus Termititenax persephonae TaxID=2218525 RepID=A0A388TJD9_9BACT|nr:putative ORF6N domain protein [Candidatus Termititenax persephonae]